MWRGVVMSKIVAMAVSTGGPKALKQVIPRLPADLDAPVILVQHMLEGFTKDLAKSLMQISMIEIKEAEDHEQIKKGCVYLARGGQHLNYAGGVGLGSLYYSDQPNRQGVKPCADYMYESLVNSPFDEVVCVVMTGMGHDATEGIVHLEKRKKIFVIAQNRESCTVYGMPRSIVEAGKADRIVPLDQIAQEIILRVGVRKDGR